MATLVPDIIPKINRLTWLGWAVVVLGLLAIVSPLTAGKATVILVGLIMLIAGLAQLLAAFRADQSGSSRLLTSILGAITAVAAMFVLAHPLPGFAFLTFLLVAYLVCEGFWKIIVSPRSMHAAGFCGSLIWKQWPLAGTSAVGRRARRKRRWQRLKRWESRAVGNSIAGAIGGGLGGQVLSALLGLGGTAAASGMDVGSIVSAFLTGGVSGGLQLSWLVF